MAGMRALGRVDNVVGSASAVGINLDDCSGIQFVAFNTGTLPASLGFTCSKTLAGTYQQLTTANGFSQPAYWYQSVAGTTSWTKQTATWTAGTLTAAGGAAGGAAGYTTLVDFLVSELADGYPYIKVTGTNCNVTAIKYDLTVQRSPENLQVPSS